MLDRMELKNQMALQGIGLKALSEKSGVSIDTLTRILNHDRRPTMVTVGKIASALGIEPKKLLKE